MQTVRMGVLEKRECTRPPARESFELLLAAASPRGRDITQIRMELGLDQFRFERLLTELQEGYMLDVVSYLDGRRVRETLRLTEHGTDVLLEVLSGVAELPERD